MAIEIKHDEEEVTKPKTKGKAKTNAKEVVKFAFPKGSTVNVLRPTRFGDAIWIPKDRILEVDASDKAKLAFVRSVSGIVEL